MVELSIIVPTSNDSATLPKAMEELHGIISFNSLSVETLIIDEESSDGTLEVARNLAYRYPALRMRLFERKQLQPGFGGVVRYGMAFANGRYCALVSADGHDPVELIPKLVRSLRAGTHLVQVSRFLNPGDSSEVKPIYRMYQSIYRLATKLLLGQSAADTTYGFRAFDRVFLQTLGLSSKRFNICPEMNFKVLLCHGRLEYIPGKTRGLGEGGQAKFQLPREIFGYAYVLVRGGLHRAGIIRWF